MERPRILILGGTSEARLLAEALAARRDCDLLLSLAGRTEKPAVQPVPVRIGGFGGAAALADFLKAGGYHLLIDATHPFAERISANAAFAAEATGIAAIALRRPEWQCVGGDRWREVQSIPAAIAALGPAPRHVFLATGRQGAHHAEAAPHHRYLVRSVDPVEPPLALENVDYVIDRGPFTLEGECDLLRQHHIDVIIAKNSGGAATYAKIEAARLLGIEVMMVARAPASTVTAVETVEATLAVIDHLFPPAMKRGV
ncbi:precorrin-6A/cobalt-precorrin-6A reductase [Rhizobium leguminosarum]|uniref:Precorrin-6A/cobalt-precorrin-6A reductase n=1 Tax=Rhizobium leguminosarum TaxID=384 RepID=A0AAE2MNK8_RHILE|nr:MULTISPECIES: cobalt-precorrin-6A reductase [Rhizobium]MBB4292069.1 precorrin-6A/cobalt-precorrin-6A reductase [Rhizobium leguminosarum]MBB4299617.1 precorrin-6A/cobalt-precorrin-6A reductase [Rhizobium leguminosarum]MBB4309993.1 precorrin-6A/cobalt-precorrin-6A reductase [Rhizobium leguminosarum]MBB4419266.1 precorrin-6A/cobalt-precorrin-6A reductase [Rhizobium leguminosarum]MBB4434069.1 precorrin-6A/cobalt-precorrin-6A reductase [Rhizobium esperanzae]